MLKLMNTSMRMASVASNIAEDPLGEPVPQTPRKIRLLGMPISVVTEAQAVAHVIDSLAAGEGGWVITPNLDQLRLFRKSPDLRPMYEEASLIVADGMPLIWASRLQKTPLPERVAGSSMIHTLSIAAAKTGRSVFFLGGNPGAADRAADELRQDNPGLKVAGTYCPPFGFDKNAVEVENIRKILAETKPDIIYVGLGFPKQERLIEQLRSALPLAWFLGIGISFSFVAGEVKRAPQWMQKLGLEWVHRMIQEPGRLFKRYLVHGIPFAARLLGAALWARFTGAKN
jgi:N-acetylglucosaminyldiphosphoundecaprenol N-acetyl-beta-D-mannosaminyltransferase